MLQIILNVLKKAMQGYAIIQMTFTVALQNGLRCNVYSVLSDRKVYAMYRTCNVYAVLSDRKVRANRVAPNQTPLQLSRRLQDTFNPLSASHNICRLLCHLLVILKAIFANSVDPDQTAPLGAV